MATKCFSYEFKSVIFLALHPGHVQTDMGQSSGRSPVLDATLTDIEFNENFVEKQSDWLRTSRPIEPDLEVDGLSRSWLARILSAIGLG